MKNSNNRTLFYVVVFSLLICICFTALVGCKWDKNPDTTSGESTPTPEVTTPEPVVTTPSADTTTESTTTEEVTTTPDPVTSTAPLPSTPAETTTVTPETTVLPAPIASSGTFKMDTGSTLGFRVDWSLDKFEDGFAYIDVKVILHTYEIYVSARKNLGIINFGEDSIRFSTDRISYGGKKPTEIILTVVQVAVPADGDIAVAYLEGKWFYNGNYARVDYDWLSAGGYICVQKPQ